MNKMAVRFFVYTFGIMLICWGTCWGCSASGIYIQENPWLYPLYMLGGWSPTIASYITLRQFHCVDGIKQWLQSVFAFRTSVRNYLVIVLMAVVFLLPQCLISGYEKGAPLLAALFLIPMMLLGGGLEEAGWRYVLQPELEKKHGFVISTLIVSVIWWLWHLPLFYIQGVSQYGDNFVAFGLNVLGLSFALAMIRKRTNNVWLCVLYHCVINSLSGIYLVKDNIWGNVVSAVIMVIVSLLLVNTREEQKL